MRRLFGILTAVFCLIALSASADQTQERFLADMLQDVARSQILADYKAARGIDVIKAQTPSFRLTSAHIRPMDDQGYTHVVVFQYDWLEGSCQIMFPVRMAENVGTDISFGFSDGGCGG